jgi:hypothetical protein
LASILEAGEHICASIISCVAFGRAIISSMFVG